MRILLDYRPALERRTGVGEYAHGLAAALAERLSPADSLTLFSSSWKGRLPAAVLPGAGQVDSRIPVRVLNLMWHRLGWPPIESIAGAADVVHAFHPLLIPARSAAQLVTVHDLYFLDRPEHTSAEIRRDYPALAGRHARRADGVIVNSEHTGRQVAERLGVEPGRITVCYPGNPGWPRRADPAQFGPILFVGTIEPRKNLPRLIEAYETLLARRPHLPDLVLAGALPAGATPPRADVPGRVRMTGYIDADERLRLYREASMLVLPSLDEGFGLPALEAMTIGLPVVASNRGALPEVLGDAGILVDPEDVNALAGAMERVWTDAGLRRAMSDRGVARGARFTWAASAARLLEAYQDACRRRSAT